MTTTDDQTPKTETTSPIPPPEHPKQYRAIGLLWGKYVPGEEITQGTLVTGDGTNIDAVILGKLLGLLKSRIDLEKEHLWVVYPRTRDRGEKSLDESGNPLDTTSESTSKTESPASPPDLSNEPKGDDEPSPEEPEAPPELSEEFTGDSEPSLHVQMAGIWEPETLHPDSPAPVIEQKPDYFSIRGEVVYQNKEEGWVMVKIVQKPQKPSEKPPYFNLKLLGFLPERPVKNFWNLHVEREGINLVIQDGERIAYLGKKKPKKGKPNKGKPTKGKPIKRSDAGQQPAPAAALPKEPPKLKKKQPGGGS